MGNTSVEIRVLNESEKRVRDLVRKLDNVHAQLQNIRNVLDLDIRNTQRIDNCMCSLIKELENNCNNLNKFASFIKGASKDYEDSEKSVKGLLNNIENKTKTIRREISDFWDAGKSKLDEQTVKMDGVKEFAQKVIDWGGNFDILNKVDETVDYLTNLVDTNMEDMFEYLNKKADECFNEFEDFTGISEKNMVYNFIKDKMKENIGILEGGVDEVVDMVVGIVALAVKFDPKFLSLRISNGIQDIIINPDKYINKAKELKNTIEYLVKHRGEVVQLILEEAENYGKELGDDPYKRGQVIGHIAVFIASLFIGGGEAKVASKAEDTITVGSKIERLLSKAELKRLTVGKSPEEIAEIMECIGKYGDDVLKVIKKGIDPELIKKLDDIGIKPGDYEKLGIISRESAEALLKKEKEILESLNSISKNLKRRIEAEADFVLRYSDSELEDIVRKGKNLGLDDKTIEDFLFTGSRQKKSIDSVELMTQMENYVTLISKRGFPYKFGSHEEFVEFSKSLKKLLEKYNIPGDDIYIQGSSLRTAASKDVDLAIFVDEKKFNQLYDEMVEGIKLRTKPGSKVRANLLKSLEKGKADGRINSYYFNKVNGKNGPSFGQELFELVDFTDMGRNWEKGTGPFDISLIVKGKGFDVGPFMKCPD